MKNSFLAIAGVLIIAGLSASCNSCNNKDVPGNSNPPEVTPTESTQVGSSDEASTTSSGPGSGSASGASTGGSSGSTTFSGDGSDGRTDGTAVNKSKNIQNGTAGKKSLKGYSAPNGTAAENNDGDMYTKHDTTRMPTGTPIK